MPTAKSTRQKLKVIENKRKCEMPLPIFSASRHPLPIWTFADPPFGVVPPSDCLFSISQTIVSVKPEFYKNGHSFRAFRALRPFFYVIILRFKCVKHDSNTSLNFYLLEFCKKSRNLPQNPAFPGIVVKLHKSPQTQADSQNPAFGEKWEVTTKRYSFT